jgi:Cu2+-exporting ATPase
VEKTLNAMQGAQAVVTLNPPIATISMGKPIQTMHFQELLSAAGNYSIKVFNPNDALLPTEEVTIAPPKNAAGKYYCPMFCEDDKVYDEGRLSCLWYGLGTSTRPNTSENNVHLPHAS